MSGPVGLGVASGINVEDNADRANCGAADASARPSLRDMLRVISGRCDDA